MGHENGGWMNDDQQSYMKEQARRKEIVRESQPSKPGYYWALWLTASPGTPDGNELTPARDWEVVQVWENFLGEPCEADACEKWGVSVPGVRETQWLENFRWGERVERRQS